MNLNNSLIHGWKQEYKLTHNDISEITGYSISSVKKWFVGDGADGGKEVPDRAIRLFRYWMENPKVDDNDLKIIVFANQKGGCGKTTLSLNFAKMLAKRGEKVLAIDNDSQGNLSFTLLGKENYPPQQSSTLIHLGKEIDPIKIDDNLYFIGSDENLVDIDKKTAIEVFFNLRDSIKKMAIKHGFTYVIIDSPPSLGTVFISGLIAANNIVIPVYPEAYHMQGLVSLMQKIKVAQQPGLSPNLKLAGIILNRVNRGTVVYKHIRQQLHEAFGSLVLTNEISQCTAVIESQTPAYSNSIEEYAQKEKRKGEKPLIEFNRVLDELINNFETRQ